MTVVAVVFPFTGMAQDARGDRDDQNEGLLEEAPEEILSGYDKQVNMFGHARKLYEAARDGDHMTLFTILADLPLPLRVRFYVNTIVVFCSFGAMKRDSFKYSQCVKQVSSDKTQVEMSVLVLLHKV